MKKKQLKGGYIISKEKDKYKVFGLIVKSKKEVCNAVNNACKIIEKSIK